MSRYTIVLDSDAPPWAQRLAVGMNDILARIGLNEKPKRFLKADLPTDDSIRLAIVTNEVGGEVLAFFDSAGAWRRVTDRAVVS
jgi:hypothetical protein